MTSGFDHLHIKRNTAGSSNELSFDVLDAARTDLDQKQSRKKKAHKSRQAYRGSYHGVKGTAPLSAQAEVKERKRKRRARSLKLWAVVAVVCVVAIGFLAWFGYRHYMEVQDFSTRFSLIINEFVEEDALISEVDSLMDTLSDNSRSKERKAASEKFPAALQKIEAIKQSAESSRQFAVTDEDEMALAQLRQTADARMGMLNAATEAFELAEKRDERTKRATQLWNDLVDEVQQAKEASSKANQANTIDATKEARDITKSSLDGIKKTKQALKGFSEEEPKLALEAQLSYLDTKEAALEHALATSDALLQGDRTAAAENNDKYNAEDENAAAQAAKLPLSLDSVVSKVYDPEINRLTKTYEDMRGKVITADSFVRSYLSKR